MAKTISAIIFFAFTLLALLFDSATPAELRWCAHGPSDGYIVNRRRGDGHWKFYDKIPEPAMEGDTDRRYPLKVFNRRDRYRVAEYNAKGRSEYSNVLNLRKPTEGGCL